MNLRVIFWGVGKTAKRVIMEHSLFMEFVYVVGFTDTDAHKWGTLFEGYNVEKPSAILQEKYDYIVILSIYSDEIKNTLVKTYSVPSRQILLIDDAYELFFRGRYDADNEYRLSLPKLLAGLSISEKSYKRVLEEVKKCFSYLQLKDKYLPYIQDMESRKDSMISAPAIEKSEVPIWVCWLQGVENAPDIVKCCINSIKKNVEGTVHIVTYENYSSYVDIEKNIIDKHEAGLISKTHFSDILRLALLYQYGGIWIDATILLMDYGLPDYVYKLPLFMYKLPATMDEGYYDPRKFSSWFMAAQKENAVIGMTYKVLNYYWSEEKTYPYFLMHYVMRLLWDKYDSTDKNKLILYNSNCQVLSKILNNSYDVVLWEMMKEEQPIQKLTYKNSFTTGDTFYRHICDTYMDLQ